MKIFSQKAQFNHVIVKLSLGIAGVVRDLIITSSQAPYDILKQKIKARTSTSARHKVLHSAISDHNKPSKFLRSIKQLIGDNITDSAM